MNKFYKDFNRKLYLLEIFSYDTLTALCLDLKSFLKNNDNFEE